MNTPAAVAAALALLAAPAARAQPVSARSGPDTYLELHLGAYLPQARDLDAYDPGLAVSGTFGAMFTRSVGVEASLGYTRATAAYRPVGPGLGFDATVSDLPVLVSLRLVAPLRSVELSARAGAGIHFASLHHSAGSSGSWTATGFGLQAGASAGFYLSPTMLVGLDVLGTVAEARLDGSPTRLDGLTVAVTLGYKL